MYMALKHSHMLFIALSVSFLAVRFLLSLRAPALLQKSSLKLRLTWLIPFCCSQLLV